MERVVDLHALRCCTAALLTARDRLADLTVLDVQRVNVAIDRLRELRPVLVGELADTIDALLSADPDAHGARTVAALARLGRLVGLDDPDTIVALATSVDLGVIGDESAWPAPDPLLRNAS